VGGIRRDVISIHVLSTCDLFLFLFLLSQVILRRNGTQCMRKQRSWRHSKKAKQAIYVFSISLILNLKAGFLCPPELEGLQWFYAAHACDGIN